MDLEEYIVQVPSWDEREPAGDDDCTKVQGDHASAVSFHIPAPDGDVGIGYTVHREEAKKMDPAKVVEQSRTHLGLHEQGDGGREQHQDHIGFTQAFMQGRPLSDQ